MASNMTLTYNLALESHTDEQLAVNQGDCLERRILQ